MPPDMQLTDSHTTEYIQRLREEPVLLALTSEAQAYLRRIGDTRNLAFLALRETEHFYYKTAAVYGAMRHLVATAKASPDGVAAEPVADPAAMAATPATAPNGAAADGDEGEKFTDLIKLQIPQVRRRRVVLPRGIGRPTLLCPFPFPAHLCHTYAMANGPLHNILTVTLTPFAASARAICGSSAIMTRDPCRGHQSSQGRAWGRSGCSA